MCLGPLATEEHVAEPDLARFCPCHPQAVALEGHAIFLYLHLIGLLEAFVGLPQHLPLGKEPQQPSSWWFAHCSMVALLKFKAWCTGVGAHEDGKKNISGVEDSPSTEEGFLPLSGLDSGAALRHGEGNPVGEAPLISNRTRGGSWGQPDGGNLDPSIYGSK